MSSHSAQDGHRSPESTDRLMVGACGAVWLLLLVVAVVASVALVNLGSDDRPENPWLLYTVIAVSALTILGAIPLLMRARRDAVAGQPESDAPAEPQVPPVNPQAPAGKVRVFGAAVDPQRRLPEVRVDSPVVNAVQRVWLRGTVSLLGAMGLALTAVAAATYLLTRESDTAAAGMLGVAAVVTAAMPVLLVMYNRRLDAAVSG